MDSPRDDSFGIIEHLAFSKPMCVSTSIAGCVAVSKSECVSIGLAVCLAVSSNVVRRARPFLKNFPYVFIFKFAKPVDFRRVRVPFLSPRSIRTHQHKLDWRLSIEAPSQEKFPGTHKFLTAHFFPFHHRKPRPESVDIAGYELLFEFFSRTNPVSNSQPAVQRCLAVDVQEDNVCGRQQIHNNHLSPRENRQWIRVSPPDAAVTLIIADL